VIGSGGYGCVFHPALKCIDELDSADSANNNREKYVSKLMLNKYAKQEYQMIARLDSRLSTIEKYQDYFLTKNISTCKVRNLTRKDVQKYTTKCKPLIKKGITRRNINTQLDKLTAVMIPHGGVEINDHVVRNINNHMVLSRMFDAMAILVSRGLVPMNALGVYHGDLKASNLMVRDNKVRMIDWGLTFIHESGEVDVHRLASDRPFQFNVPFSI